MAFVVAALCAGVLAGLSVRADARLRGRARLPMQWDWRGRVNWTAPRPLALWLVPALGTAVLTATAAAATFGLPPRPGQEGTVLPVLCVMGAGFVAIHLLHLSLIRWTLRREDGRGDAGGE